MSSQVHLPCMPAGFPGGALVPDLVNQSHQMFASHQGDSLRELASVAVDNPMTTEGLVDPSGGHSLTCSTTHVGAQHWVHVTGKEAFGVAHHMLEQPDAGSAPCLQSLQCNSVTLLCIHTTVAPHVPSSSWGECRATKLHPCSSDIQLLPANCTCQPAEQRVNPS